VFQLGGKNAGIIFADADLDKCITTTIRLVNSPRGAGTLALHHIIM